MLVHKKGFSVSPHRGVSPKSYGIDMATNKLVAINQPVGVIVIFHLLEAHLLAALAHSGLGAAELTRQSIEHALTLAEHVSLLARQSCISQDNRAISSRISREQRPENPYRRHRQ